jgi:hypothetical protein
LRHRRVNLQWKLLGNAGLILALLAVIAVSGITSLGHVNRIAQDTFAEATQPLADLGTARAKANENRALLNSHILAAGDDERAELEQQIADNEALIDERLAAVAETLQTDEGRASFDALEADLAAYRSARDEVLASRSITQRPTASASLRRSPRRRSTSPSCSTPGSPSPRSATPRSSRPTTPSAPSRSCCSRSRSSPASPRRGGSRAASAAAWRTCS